MINMYIMMIKVRSAVLTKLIPQLDWNKYLLSAKTVQKFQHIHFSLMAWTSVALTILITLEL